MLVITRLLALVLGATTLAVLPLFAGAGAGAARPGAIIDCPGASAPPGTAAPATAPASPAPSLAVFPADGGNLTVFAAASLTDAFERIAADLEAAHPGLEITFNFAGSQTLVTQLDQGARADVFAAADDVQMRTAVATGSISGEPVIFARNRLTIVAPAGNPAGLEAPSDLARDGVRLVLAQPDVPVGRYARQALCALASDAPDGQDFPARVAVNLVSEEANVREVLTKVRLGEADTAIVYVSDAEAAGDAVEHITIPPDFNVEAIYPAAAVAGGNTELAAAFIAALLAPAGQEALAAVGFEPVTP